MNLHIAHTGRVSVIASGQTHKTGYVALPVFRKGSMVRLFYGSGAGPVLWQGDRRDLDIITFRLATGWQPNSKPTMYG